MAAAPWIKRKECPARSFRRAGHFRQSRRASRNISRFTVRTDPRM